jgi:hypothetical protein
MNAPRIARALAALDLAVLALALAIGAAFRFGQSPAGAGPEGLALLYGFAGWFSSYLRSAPVLVLAALALLAAARAADRAPRSADAPRGLVLAGRALLAVSLLRAISQLVFLGVYLSHEESGLAFPGGTAEKIFHTYYSCLTGLLPEFALLAVGFCLLRLPRCRSGAGALPTPERPPLDLGLAGFVLLVLSFVFMAVVFGSIENGSPVSTFLAFGDWLEATTIPATLCVALAALSRRARGNVPWRPGRFAALSPALICAAIAVLIRLLFSETGSMPYRAGLMLALLLCQAHPVWLALATAAERGAP